MSDSDGFTLVKYKYPKQNKFKKRQNGNPKDFSTFPPTSNNDKQFDLVLNNINQCKMELQDSPFYKEIILSVSKILSTSTVNSEKISINFQDFVCYGIGKISESPTSRYQFALLVLLWQHFKPSGKCSVYDPVFGNLDQQIVEHFELELIPRNEEAKRNVSQKTLFFVPHGGKPLYNNILWANWGAGLENVIIFGNSFASYQERIPSYQLEIEASYIARIVTLTHEVRLRCVFHHDDVFNDMSFHHFADLSKLPLSFWQDCKEPVYEDNNVEIILNVS